MNPRRRRLLIPGLLVVLIIVVVVVSIGRQAEAAEGPDDAERLGSIDDPRITESSGLAISADDPDLAYTINDSGSVDAVYAVELTSGEVVGTTTLTGTRWIDTEALALHDGTLWVADTGDNTGVRDEVALYSLPEPGRGDRTVEAARHPVDYPDGPLDVEALAVDPRSGEMVLVAKQVLEGPLLTLPANLSQERTTTAEATDVASLSLATDAAWTPDGRHVVVRNYGEAQVLEPGTGEVVATLPLPEQPQGESLAVTPDGSAVVVGSEGTPSQLWSVGLPAVVVQDTAPDPSADPTTDAAQGSTGTVEDAGRRWLTPVLSAVALGGLVVLAVWSERPRRRRRRRR